MGEWGRTADVGYEGMQQFGGKSFLSVYTLSLTYSLERVGSRH